MFARPRVSWRLAAFCLCILLAGLAHARAGVLILNDGSDGQSARIRIQSAISRGELAAFDAAVDQVNRTAKTEINGVPFITVELDSPGGDVVEAMGIGRSIYRHSAMTLVRPGNECVSACVFIMVAGAVRTPGNGAAIGVHRPLLVSWRNMSYAQAKAKYDGLMDYIRGYFAELGVSDATYATMMRTDSNDMRYFSPSELDDMHLRGESPQWRSRYVAARAAPVQAGRTFTAAPPPELPKIDESWRDIVFMPGALPPDRYFAGVRVPNLLHYVWEPIDANAEMLDWSAPDVSWILARLIDGAAAVLGSNGWILLLILFELYRGRYVIWPGDPTLEPSSRDQWRLRPFRPTAASRPLARAAGEGGTRVAGG
jgi:hypothetical protein